MKKLVLSILTMASTFVMADCLPLYEKDVNNILDGEGRAHVSKNTIITGAAVSIASPPVAILFLIDKIGGAISNDNKEDSLKLAYATLLESETLIKDPESDTPTPALDALIRNLQDKKPGFNFLKERVAKTLIESSQKNLLCSDGKNEMLFSDIVNGILNESLEHGEPIAFKNYAIIFAIEARDTNNEKALGHFGGGTWYGHEIEMVNFSRSGNPHSVNPYLKERDIVTKSFAFEIEDAFLSYSLCKSTKNESGSEIVDLKFIYAFGSTPEVSSDKLFSQCMDPDQNLLKSRFAKRGKNIFFIPLEKDLIEEIKGYYQARINIKLLPTNPSIPQLLESSQVIMRPSNR